MPTDLELFKVRLLFIQRVITFALRLPGTMYFKNSPFLIPSPVNRCTDHLHFL